MNPPCEAALSLDDNLAEECIEYREATQVERGFTADADRVELVIVGRAEPDQYRLQCEVKHAIRGRLRVAVWHLYDKEVFEHLQRYVSTWNGVTSVEASPYCGSVTIGYDFTLTQKAEILKTLTQLSIQAIIEAGAALPPAHLEDHEISYNYLRLATIGVGASVAFMGVPFVAMGVVFPYLVYISVPIFTRAFNCLVTERRLNVDFLDSLAIVTGILTGDVFNASLMVWLIHLGDYIRDLTASSTQRTIRQLLDFQDNEVWVVRDDVEVKIKVKDLVKGDVVALHVGDLIPVDGEVIEGELIVDQQVLTGESMPIHKEVDDRVYAATVIREGKAYVRALKVGDDTKVAQVVHLVEEAPLSDTKIQNHAENFADQLVAPSLAGSLLLYASTMNMAQLTAMLTVDFGTGVRVSAPTAVLSCMSYAAHNGIVIKGGRYLETLCQAVTVVFDKTGTLTTGVIHVEDVVSFNGYEESDILALAATAELQLTHPIAEAVVRCAEQRAIPLRCRDQVEYVIGRGVRAEVEGMEILVGSLRLLRENAVALDESLSEVTDLFVSEGKACLYVAINRDLAGVIAFRDQIRPEAKKMIRELHRLGIKQVVMLTGDVRKVAEPVAKTLGVDLCIAEMLPEQKAEVIIDLKKQGHVVAFVGDGINDSVALTYADIGFSVRNGADITKETAGVILLSDNLEHISKAFEISRRTIGLIKQNYWIVGVFNVVAYVLAGFGLVSLVATTLISNGSSVVACVNGMRPMMNLPKANAATAQSSLPQAQLPAPV